MSITMEMSEEIDREEKRRAKLRGAVEKALDEAAGSGSTEERRTAAARAFLVNWESFGLVDQDCDYFWQQLRESSQELGLQFTELALRRNADHYGSVLNLDRKDLIEWVEWCLAHAPERLGPVGKKLAAGLALLAAQEAT